jgi:hypothetical protein
VRIFIALFFLLLPVAARTMWFFDGKYKPRTPIEIPAYEEMTIPQAEISTVKEVEDNFEEGIDAPTVLIDFSHDNYFSLSEIDALTGLLVDKGAKIEIASEPGLLEVQLKYADSYVVIAPTYHFTIEEINVITKFVGSGGHLLVIADPTRNYDEFYYYDTVSVITATDLVNMLIAPFDIRFKKDYVYNLSVSEANFRNVIFKEFSESRFTKDLDEIVFYGAHSIETNQIPLIVGDASTYSSLNDTGGDIVTAASTHDDRVLAIGDVNFLTPPYHQVSTNYKLIENITDFLVSEEREHDLSNFPYIFTRPVVLLNEDEKTLDRDFLDLFRTAQETLSNFNIILKVSQTPLEDHDLIVFGTYSNWELLADFIDPFGLSFDFDPSLVEVEQEEELDWLDYVDEEEIILEEDSLDLESTNPDEATETDEEALPASEILVDEELLDDEEGVTVNIVEIPDFGTLATSGVGIILYTQTSDQNTLILLAETIAEVGQLAGLISSGELYDCAMLEQIALCSTYLSDYDDYY